MIGTKAKATHNSRQFFGKVGAGFCLHYIITLSYDLSHICDSLCEKSFSS